MAPPRFMTTFGNRPWATTQSGGRLPSSKRDVQSRRHGSYVDMPVGRVSLILYPWLCFILVVGTFFIFHGFMSNFVLIVPLFLAICAVGHMWEYSRPDGKVGHGQVSLGSLCLAGCVGGFLMGSHIRSGWMNDYWRLGRGASYINVLASEPARGHLDATMLSFAEGTRIDLSRSFGYMEGGGYGTVYCAAPILDTTALTGQRVEYWAVGTNCCAARGQFQCDDATSDQAHGGVVLPVSSQDQEGLRQAIEGAERQYDLVSSRGYALVRWVNDPSRWRYNLRRVGLAWTFSSIGAFLVLSLVMGCTVYRSLQ